MRGAPPQFAESGAATAAVVTDTSLIAGRPAPNASSAERISCLTAFDLRDGDETHDSATPPPLGRPWCCAVCRLPTGVMTCGDGGGGNTSALSVPSSR